MYNTIDLSAFQKLQDDICCGKNKISDRIRDSKRLKELVKLRKIDLMNCTQLLKTMMNNLGPDTGRRLCGEDESSSKLDLHIIALEIVQAAVQVDCQKLLTANILTTGIAGHLFSLLDLSTSHNGCCYKATEGGWSLEHVAAAKELLEGQIVQGKVSLSGLKSDLSDEVYSGSLTLSDGRRVCEVFVEQGVTEKGHFREAKCKDSGGSYKVSHVISPQFVWLQPSEDKAELIKLSGVISQRAPLASSDKSDSRVLIRLPDSSVSFRGDVLERDDQQVTVLAIDYGWTTTLPCTLLYKLTPEECKMSPGALLCRLNAVYNSTPQVRIQQMSLSVLQHVAKVRNWSDIVFTQDRNKLLTEIMTISEDPAIISTIVTILSLLVNNGRRPPNELESVMKVTSRFINCSSIALCAMQFFRNYVVRNEEIFVKRKGLELVFTVLKHHPKHQRIRYHCQAIFSRCFRGTEVETEPEEIIIPWPEKPSGPSSERFEMSSVPEAKVFRFQQEFLMPCPDLKEVVFISRLSGKEDERKLGQAVASLLNTSGGKVYVGVDEGVENPAKRGVIRGLKTDRKMRDKYNLFLDDCLTNSEVMEHVTSLGAKIKISQSYVSAEFEQIDNTYEIKLERGVQLMMFIVSVKPLSDGLCLVTDGQGKNVCYCRSDEGLVVMSPNAIRQKLVN